VRILDSKNDLDKAVISELGNKIPSIDDFIC